MRLATALIALFLGGCATVETTAPTLEQLSSFDKGNQSILVINASTNIGCGDFLLGINRNNSPTNQVVRTLNDFGYDTSQPAILIVEPGKFTLNRASCTIPGYYPSDLPNTFAWFGDLDVTAGEVVYIGTFHTDVLEVQTKRGAAAQVFSALLAFDFGKSDSRQFPTYEFTNQLEELLERLRVSHPELAEQVVFRPIPQVIAKAEFSAALQRAYAPDENGIPPTPEQAKENWANELMALSEKVISADPGVEQMNSPPQASDAGPTKEHAEP